MKAKDEGVIQVVAKVYRQRGEQSNFGLRAIVVGTDMRVSCPGEWRDEWKVGQLLTMVGRVIKQKGGADYFKARQLIGSQ